MVAPAENGIIPNSTTFASNDHPDAGKQDEVAIVNELDEEKEKKKRVPSVKVRLFKKLQNGAASRSSKSKLEFDADDFDVPIQKMSRIKRVAFNPRISRSDWDIHDIRPGSARDEIEMLLSRNSKDVSIRSKSPNYVEEDEFKSQYFDAVETMSEEEEEDESADEYTDIEEDEPHPVSRRKRQSTVPYPVNLPQSVKKRVNALKNLLLKQKAIEVAMFKDLHRLEAKHYNKGQLVQASRRKCVEGEGQATILEEEEEGEEPRQAPIEQGVPGFWLRVLLNSKNLKQIVQANDITLLNSLVDIKVNNFEEPLGFRLTFSFRQNDFFMNPELTKDYFLKVEPGDEDDPLTFEGPEVVGCRGCKIVWKRHQNLTIRPLKRVQNHKIVTKWARKNSFFNFFNPPKPGSVDEVHHLRRRELLEAHYEIGLFFKEQVVPRAYLFFTCTGYDGKMSKSYGLKRGKLRTSSSKANTPAIPRTPRRKNSESEEKVLDKKPNALAKQEVEVTIRKQDSNDNILEIEDTQPNMLQSQVIAAEDPTEILESITHPDNDPFPGRYLMESSDKFDDFMKALGVGMIKRKLANSVVPINEVEITEDGEYKLRTLTTVRNTEIVFRLDKIFLEDTIDGRKTETTPTRVGNLLTLDQKGQRGEKDSVMTREVEGDLMTMQLIVGDVVCTRIYKRIYD